MMDPQFVATAGKVVVAVMMVGQALMVPVCLMAGKPWPALYWVAGFTITLAAGKMSGSL